MASAGEGLQILEDRFTIRIMLVQWAEIKRESLHPIKHPRPLLTNEQGVIGQRAFEYT